MMKVSASCWKDNLFTALKNKGGEGMPAYASEEVANKKYKATVTIAGKKPVTFYSKKPAEGKKAAEQAAAMAAMKGLFPEQFKVIDEALSAPVMSESAPKGETTESRWKGQLHNTIMKKSPGGIVKMKPVYKTVEDKDKMWTSKVSYGGKTYSSEPAPSKKAAENAAAKALMEAKYPEEFKFVSKGREIGGAKKPVVDEQPQGGKNKLCSAVGLIVYKNQKRSIAKGDFEWLTEESGGGFKCKVTITKKIGAEGGKNFTGSKCDSKKKAEESAAEAAYAAMKKIVGPLEDAQAKKKEQKTKDRVAALKKKTAGKPMPKKK
jgi:dsRNA-specific ribonuclease